jgi:hypothetical protein
MEATVPEQLLNIVQLFTSDILAERDYGLVYRSAVSAINAHKSDYDEVYIRLQVLAAWAAAGKKNGSAAIYHCQLAFRAIQQQGLELDTRHLCTVLVLLIPLLVHSNRTREAVERVALARTLVARTGTGADNILLDTLITQWEESLGIELR